jgi:ABC-type transport system involved in cytochrome c biogenesis ATPase subunit
MVHLSAHALACRRGERLVFTGVDFRLNGGGALLVVGPNGAGKSSLLRVLAGLLRPFAGAVLWNGLDVARDPGELHDLGAEQPDALRENVGVLDAWRADRAQRQAVGGKVDPKLTDSLRALGYVE